LHELQLQLHMLCINNKIYLLFLSSFLQISVRFKHNTIKLLPRPPSMVRMS
jgi:hypothetical protein